MSLLLRRRALLALRKPLIPAAYQQVEYIESTGTQWIDTGFFPTNNTRVEIDVRFEVVDNAIPSDGAFGVYDEGNAFSINFGSDSGTRNTLFCWVNKSIAGGGTYVNFDAEHLLPTRNVLTLSNERVSYGLLSFELQKGNWTKLSKSLRLFGRLMLSGEENPIKRRMTLYQGKIYDDDILVRNFIPCYRKSDGAAGLYDTQGGVFYTNQGTGEFLKGGDI